MKTLLTFFAALVLAEAAPQRQWVSLIKDMPPSTSSFIYNGQEASPGQFPHQLSLVLSSGFHTCGAVLVQDNVALTAAHCVNPNQPGNYRVRAGQHNLGDFASEHDIDSITQHENYDDGTGSFSNDIAVLWMASSADTSDPGIGAIACASAAQDPIGDGCQISGWGEIEDGSSPDTLRYTDIPVITNEECSTRMDECNCGTVVIDSHICVYNGQQGSCSGDSGGPMTCNGGSTLNGVTSWGISSIAGCLVSYPSVYTRISSFGGWLSSAGVSC